MRVVSSLSLSWFIGVPPWWDYLLFLPMAVKQGLFIIYTESVGVTSTTMTNKSKRVFWCWALVFLLVHGSCWSIVMWSKYIHIHLHRCVLLIILDKYRMILFLQTLSNQVCVICPFSFYFLYWLPFQPLKCPLQLVYIPLTITCILFSPHKFLLMVLWWFPGFCGYTCSKYTHIWVFAARTQIWERTHSICLSGLSLPHSV